MKILLGRSILNMFIRGCSLGCTVFIVCVPYLMSCWASCIVLLSFLYWTIVMLCGHLHLYNALKSLNVFILSFARWSRLHKVFCAILWLNIEDSILPSLFIELFISSHQLTWEKHFSTLQPLPPMLEETVIAFLYQESGLHMEKIVFTIKERRFGTQWMPQFTLQLLLDNVNTYINIILANFYLHVC